METADHSTERYESLNEQADKTGMLASDGRPPLQLTSPTEFKSEGGVWTSENLTGVGS
ncbi:MAG: hypothetical protein O7D34_10620 [Ignavibacteria bacterium]|nr:hypothetical protein [Ignavibacteria bacterium]